MCDPSGPTSFARAGASTSIRPRAKRTRSAGSSGGRTVRSRSVLDMNPAYPYSKNPKGRCPIEPPAYVRTLRFAGKITVGRTLHHANRPTVVPGKPQGSPPGAGIVGRTLQDANRAAFVSGGPLGRTLHHANHLAF